jgi:Flp pilus assembly protein TadD
MHMADSSQSRAVRFDLFELDLHAGDLRKNDWRAHNWLGVAYEGSGHTLQAIPEYLKAVGLSQGENRPEAG